MQENPPRVSRKEGIQGAGKGGGGPTRRNRYAVAVDDSGDLIECSGKYCRSCTTGLVADCVALCCCPCAVVNILALAFVKIPYMVGRKCLGLGKKKRKCKKVEASSSCGFVVERNYGDLNKGKLEIESFGEDEEEMDGSVHSARLEAERVWLELYQVGHLGFGRISFTGIQSQEKEN
ncbi:uncharacterized protein LOC116123638 [Pistacia vera]|uniref:uncharacterized protein LOC116123638 n=1 Tax=Pistacia vera TaxID=55513 RepID=UPI0012633A9E|nr:uncharacterized protein LOC116123638 [Pistacia vera]